MCSMMTAIALSAVLVLVIERSLRLRPNPRTDRAAYDRFILSEARFQMAIRFAVIAGLAAALLTGLTGL